MKKTFAPVFALFFCLAAAQADEFDDLFADPEAVVIEEAPVVQEPESSILNTASFQWAGDFTGTVKVSGVYEELAPSADELRDPDDDLAFDIGARLWFDARPDRNFRVFGKFTTKYPLTTATIFELFSDFNWDDRVFFRFGKQTAGWGLSRFYQIADPLSVGVKDPKDPAADLEGPLALKISVPVGLNSFYFYSVVKDSYLPENTADARIGDIGLGVKADILVGIPENKVMGNGELSLGAYYQRKLAPKAIASFSTSLWKLQVFTDQAVSWGLDSYRLTGEAALQTSEVTIYETEKPDEGAYYSGTFGALYVNNDWHFTGYAEYLFNAAGSGDSRYLEKYSARYLAESAGAAGLGTTLTTKDLFGYLSRHNTAVSLSWSELFGTDKLSSSVLWLQNWVDRSGMLTPSAKLTPFKHFSVESGINLVWGGDRTEWVAKNADASTFKPRRFSFFLAFSLGGGKF